MLSKRSLIGRAWCLAASLAMLPGAAYAAQPSVPYVPTPQEVVERMLEIAKVGPQDYLIDLGSGDGRIVVTAAKKFGARGFGVDLNPVRIKESVENADKAGVSDRVAFHQRNLFETDLRPKLLELKPGTRIVSHDFDMDDWKPEQAINMDVKAKYGDTPGTSTIYFWVIPAKVSGAWQWQMNIGGKPQTYELVLEQKFQVISGTVRVGGRSAKLQDARLRGDQINLVFSVEVNGSMVKHELSGRVVAGNAIEGTASFSGSRAQGQSDWSASRGGKIGGQAGTLTFAALEQ
jgi:Methyltransferase domain